MVVFGLFGGESVGFLLGCWFGYGICVLKFGV